MKPSHEDIVDAYNALPDVVSSYLAQENVGKVVSTIGSRNNLHMDTIGSLAEAVTHMLLGLISPPELMREMATMRISDTTAAAIARELNEQIFKPLHAQMRSGTIPTNQASSIPLASVPAPLGRTVPAAATQSVNPLFSEPVSRPVPAPNPIDMPRKQEVESPSRAPSPGIVSAKPYATDPYREPIE